MLLCTSLAFPVVMVFVYNLLANLNRQWRGRRYCDLTIGYCFFLMCLLGKSSYDKLREFCLGCLPSILTLTDAFDFNLLKRGAGFSISCIARFRATVVVAIMARDGLF